MPTSSVVFSLTAAAAVTGVLTNHLPSSPLLGVSTSSDEDLDNDLRQGIDNIMYVRFVHFLHGPTHRVSHILFSFLETFKLLMHASSPTSIDQKWYMLIHGFSILNFAKSNLTFLGVPIDGGSYVLVLTQMQLPKFPPPRFRPWRLFYLVRFCQISDQ